MDTETLRKVVAMLDARIDTIKLNQPAPILSDWHNGLIHGLELFKDQLRRLTIIHTELNKENEMNRGE